MTVQRSLPVSGRRLSLAQWHSGWPGPLSHGPGPASGTVAVKVERDILHRLEIRVRVTGMPAPPSPAVTARASLSHWHGTSNSVASSESTYYKY